jgi:hypothetical protein
MCGLELPRAIIQRVNIFIGFPATVWFASFCTKELSLPCLKKDLSFFRVEDLPYEIDLLSLHCSTNLLYRCKQKNKNINTHGVLLYKFFVKKKTDFVFLQGKN